MEPFSYVAAANETQALDAGRVGTFIAGGTNLVDYMRLGVLRPSSVVDINQLPLTQVKETAGGALEIGALVKNSDLAYHPLVQQRYPVLAEALLSGASPQIRNMATIGGNVLQRTRCPYFRDTATPCNKREPGSGCSAIAGINRTEAVLGTSEHCIATYPGDLAVALIALGATVRVRGASGADRAVPFASLHVLPGAHPERETIL